MAEITWRNVDSGSGSQAVAAQGQANGINTILGAFAPLEQELKNRAALADRQWDLQADQNTRDVKAQINNIKSLADLNQMQNDGQLSEETFNKQFGRQYDSGIVNSTIDARKQALQSSLLDQLNGQAMTVADQERDLAAGSAKLRELIQQNGGRSDFAQKASLAFMEGNQDRAALYSKNNRNEAEAYLSATASPTRPEEIENFVAKAQQSGVKDLDYVRGRLREELGDHYLNEKYQLDKANFALDKERVSIEKGRLSLSQQEHAMQMRIFNREEQERKAIGMASNAAIGLLQQGASSNQAFSQVRSMIPGDKQLPFLQNILNSQVAMSSLNNDQKTELSRIVDKSNNQLLKHQSALEAQDSAYIKQRNEVTGITPTILNVVDSAAKENGGIVGKILSTVSDSFGPDWFTDLGTDVNTSKSRVENDLQKYQQSITKEMNGASPQEIDAVLWLSYQDSKKTSPMGNTGLDPDSMREAINKRISAFNKGQAIEQDRLQFKKAAENEMRTLQENLSDYTYSAQKSIEKLNQTGQEGDILKTLKELENKTLTVPDSSSFGVLNSLKKQKENAVKNQADKNVRDTKEAVERLNKQRDISYRNQATGDPGAALKNALDAALHSGKNPPQAEVKQPVLSLDALINKYRK